ncbi:hypothetical protein L0337_15195 [candidate division KSB1 bacterium]|nr:hypothetical protein [candidate division KSB1 bacterium]
MAQPTDFKAKYLITPGYLTKRSKRQSGQLITPGMKFNVTHATGNSGATASDNVRFYESTKNQTEPSAHIFVDDGEIIECIPALAYSRRTYYQLLR